MAEDLDQVSLAFGRLLKKLLKSRTSVFAGKKVEYFKGKDVILSLSKKQYLECKGTKKDFKSKKQIIDFCDE
jgi:hypothetical protein